jgi:hypothetical protein
MTPDSNVGFVLIVRLLGVAKQSCLPAQRPGGSWFGEQGSAGSLMKARPWERRSVSTRMEDDRRGNVGQQLAQGEAAHCTKGQ